MHNYHVLLNVQFIALFCNKIINFQQLNALSQVLGMTTVHETVRDISRAGGTLDESLRSRLH